jgi:hypothetical protein
VFTENRRLRDELRVTHARIASLEAERNDYLRKDRRAGVLTHDAFREAASAAPSRSRPSWSTSTASARSTAAAGPPPATPPWPPWPPACASWCAPATSSGAPAPTSWP